MMKMTARAVALMAGVLVALTLGGCTMVTETDSRLDEYQAEAEGLADELIALVPADLAPTTPPDVESSGRMLQNPVSADPSPQDSVWWQVDAYIEPVQRPAASEDAAKAIANGLLDDGWEQTKARETAEGRRTADAYAKERRQMRAPGASDTSLIQDHPAIRRILATQRAWIDGGRVLAYHTALQLDAANHGANAEAQRWCALVTPVLKAAFTDQAFHGASACLQVFGGHGYVREWGIEQIVRDARVAMIYEGTNEIQAIDLLVRKVLADGGQGLAALLASLPGLPATGALAQATQALVIAAQADPALPYWVADDYLRAVALVLLEWAWGRISAASTGPRWDEPAQAFRTWVLPELDMRLSILRQRTG